MSLPWWQSRREGLRREGLSPASFPIPELGGLGISLEFEAEQELHPCPRLPPGKALMDVVGPLEPLGHRLQEGSSGGFSGVWRWRIAESLVQAGACPGWPVPGCFLGVGTFFPARMEISKCFPPLGLDKNGCFSFSLKLMENPQSYLVTETFFFPPLQNTESISLNILSLQIKLRSRMYYSLKKSNSNTFLLGPFPLTGKLLHTNYFRQTSSSSTGWNFQ